MTEAAEVECKLKGSEEADEVSDEEGFNCRLTFINCNGSTGDAQVQFLLRWKCCLLILRTQFSF